jgi:hypothetical protein
MANSHGHDAEEHACEAGMRFSDEHGEKSQGK